VLILKDFKLFRINTYITADSKGLSLTYYKSLIGSPNEEGSEVSVIKGLGHQPKSSGITLANPTVRSGNNCDSGRKPLRKEAANRPLSELFRPAH